MLGLNKLLINNVKVGVKLNTLYATGVEYMKAELPDFEVPSNFGFGIGLEYKENPLVISEKNDKTFETGMSFLIVCAFKDLKVGDKKYALILTDMVIVTKEGPEVVSNDAEKKLDEINFAIEFDEEKEKKEKKKDLGNSQPTERRKRQTKGQKNGVKLQSLQERITHQTYLKNIKN